MFRGWPLSADPAVMSWHPLKLLAQGVLGSYNAFVISIYIMATVSAGILGYVLSGSRVAGTVTGFAYALSGFMVASLDVPNVLASAASFPLVFAAIEMSRDRFRPVWTVIGALGLGMALLGAHPNVILYFSFLALAYVLFRNQWTPRGFPKGIARGALIGLLGIALGCVQLLPTLDLAAGMGRSVPNYANFVVPSLAPYLLPLPLFPYLTGGPGSTWGTPYFGSDSVVATACFVGVLPFLLSVVALAMHRRGDGVVLWLITAMISLTVALGDATPLIRIAFEIPVLNWGRGPTRILPLFNLAMAVLAGMGAAHLLRQAIPWRRFLACLGIGVLSVAGIAATIRLAAPVYAELAEQRAGISGYSLSPLENPAVAVPLVSLVLGAIIILFVRGVGWPRLAVLVLIGALLLDLSSFGWFFQWSTESPSRVVFTEPDILDRMGKVLQPTGQRYLAIAGGKGVATRSLLWGLPNEDGRSSWARAQTLPTDASDLHCRNPAHTFWAVRFIVLPRCIDRGPRPWRDELITLGDWLDDPSAAEWLGFLLAHDDTIVPRRLKFGPPAPRGSRIAMMVQGASDDGFDGTVSARITAADGTRLSVERPVTLAAGESRLIVLPFSEPEDQRRVAALAVRADGRLGSLRLETLAVDDPDNKRLFPARLDHALAAPGSGWRLTEDTPGYRLFERTTETPRAWLAEDVLTLEPEHRVGAYRLGLRPDGRPLDPLHTVILEQAVSLEGEGVARPDIGAPSVRIVESGGIRMALEVSAPRPAVLVVADVWDTSWRATMDGYAVPILRANGDSRGIVVPAGRHEVVMTYRPMPFLVGAGVTVLALCGVAGLIGMAARRAGAGRFGTVAAGLAPVAIVVVLVALPFVRSPASWSPAPLEDTVMRASLRDDTTDLGLLPSVTEQAVVPNVLEGRLAALVAPRTVLTPLNAAILLGHNESVAHMLERGVPVSEIDLCLARAIDYTRMETLLLEHIDASGALPVLCRVAAGAERALHLARMGLATFRPSGPDEDISLSVQTLAGTPVRHLAAGNRSLIESAIANGWHPDTTEPYQIGSEEVTLGPILVPVLLDDVSYVEMLLKAGVDLDRPATKLAMCEARRRGLSGAEAVFERALYGRPWPDCSQHRAPWVEPLRKELLRIREQYS